MSRMRSTDQISKVVEWIDGATIHRSTGFEEGEGATTGFAWSLYDFNLNLLTKLIPIVSREISTSSHKEVKALKQSLGNLFLWGDGFRDGRLQSILEESDDLKETVLSSLVGIGRLLISKIAVRVRSTSTDEGVEALVRELTILLEKARIIENEFDSEGVYDGDNTDLEDYEYHNELSMSINSLATYTTCLMDLLPSMEDTLNFASLAEDEDQSPSPLDFHVSGPARTYILNIFDRFSKANSQLVERLGEANWQRHIALRNGLVKEVVSAAVAIEEAPKSVFVPVSLFQDSGHGTSLPAHISYAATSASHTSFVSNQSNEEGGGLRVPPTPKAVSKGIPFTCGICGQTLSKIKNRIDWKRHVFADLKPYICTFSDCKDTLRTFPTRKLWEAHEFDHHRFDAVICCSVCPSKFPTKDEIQTHLRAKHKKLLEMKKALGISLGLREQRQPQEATSLSCPLCLCIPGKSRRNFVTHVGKHMESIALAALPRENGSDSESDSDHESATTAFVRGIPNEYVNDSIPTTTNVYGCGYCDYEPSSEDNWKASSALARHVRREHSHQKKINYESDTEGEKSHPRRNSWDSGVGSATASDRASLGTADDEDELELAQAVPPPIHAASSATTAGADFALAELQSSLEYENLKKQKNTINYDKDSYTFGFHRGTASKVTNKSKFLSQKSLGGDNTRSMPISSSLVGSVYIPLSQQQADKAKLARWPIVHLLALGPTTKKDLRAKVNDCSDQDFEAIFDRVSDLNEISGKYELRQRFFKELDVWVFKYDSSEDRQRAIDNAIKIYDKMRLGLSEPEWDRLLVRAERGTGKHLSKIQANLGPSRWRPNGAEGNA